MKKIVIRVLVMLTGILIALAAIEIGVRIFWNKLQGPIIPLSLKIHRVSPNPKLGYELVPESSSFEDNAWYRISEDGLRDDAYSRSKSPGIFRIAAVGDSVTFGMGLELPDAWPKQLEKELRTYRKGIQVLNFGVMGYDTTQETEAIAEKVLGFSPDLIVIGYSLNDIGVLSRERRVLSQYRGYNSFLTTGIGFIDRMLSLSKLYLLLKNRFFLKKTRADTQPPHYSKDGQRVIRMGYSAFLQSAYSESENLNRLKAALAKIRSLTQPKIPVLVVILPELQNFDGYPLKEVHEFVKKIMAEYGFRVFDPLADFLKYRPQELRISDSNTHPNAFGNKILSETIARYLKSSSLL